MFLNSRFGRLQTDRKITGGTRPALDYDEIRSILIPLLPLDKQNVIHSCLHRAEQAESNARNLYAQAQALLAAELGLDKLDLSESLYSVRRASEVRKAGRADAEFFSERYQRILALMQRSGQTLEDVALDNAAVQAASGPAVQLR